MIASQETILLMSPFFSFVSSNIWLIVWTFVVFFSYCWDCGIMPVTMFFIADFNISDIPSWLLLFSLFLLTPCEGFHCWAACFRRWLGFYVQWSSRISLARLLPDSLALISGLRDKIFRFSKTVWIYLELLNAILPLLLGSSDAWWGSVSWVRWPWRFWFDFLSCVVKPPGIILCSFSTTNYKMTLNSKIYQQMKQKCCAE